MKLKLTPAQKSVLIELSKAGKFDCVDNYKPALKLIELGVVNSERLRYGLLRLTANDRTGEAVEPNIPVEHC